LRGHSDALKPKKTATFLGDRLHALAKAGILRRVALYPAKVTEHAAAKSHCH
jgi:hypothetical protein